MRRVYAAAVVLSPLVFQAGALGVAIYVAVLAVLIARVELRTPRSLDFLEDLHPKRLEERAQSGS